MDRIICQKSRISKKDSAPSEYEALEPFEEISVDYVVNLPEDKFENQYILVVVDNFTIFCLSLFLSLSVVSGS